MNVDNCRLALAVFVLLGAACRPVRAAGDPADTHPDLPLTPWPKSLTAGTGHMPLAAGSRIVFTEAQLEPLAEVLANDLATLTGLKLKVATDAPRAGDIVLGI